MVNGNQILALIAVLVSFCYSQSQTLVCRNIMLTEFKSKNLQIAREIEKYQIFFPISVFVWYQLRTKQYCLIVLVVDYRF